MEAVKKTVFGLFEIERRYVVPLFQRPYVWTREDQWEPLWEDIESKCREKVRGTEKPHFLGAIVLDQSRTPSDSIDVRLIVDGQQRLTTMQLFLKALRDITEIKVIPRTEGKPPKVIAQLRKLTEHEISDIDESETFKLWPSESDRESFKRVMTANSLECVKALYPATSNDERRNVAAAYCFFSERIDDFLHKSASENNNILPATPIERLEVLMSVIQHLLRFIVIDLEPDDDPQMIFETLNARGEPLLVSDLVRNYVFLMARDQKLDIESLYDKYWRHYDSDQSAEMSQSGQEMKFWHTEDVIGRERRSRLDFFLATYLRYISAKEDTNMSRLYQVFKEWWEQEIDDDVVSAAPTIGVLGKNDIATHEPSLGDPSRNAVSRVRDTAKELARLKTHSSFFRSFIDPDTTTALGSFANRLKVFDTTTLFPVLLFLRAREGTTVTPDQLTYILKDLESYVVRRSICGLTTKAYNRIFIKLLVDMKESGNVDQAFVRERLLATRMDEDRRGDSTKWPTDDEFRAFWLSRPAYKKLYSARTQSILLALEQHLRTYHESSGRQEKIGLPPNLTIEHVLPQSWSGKWPDPDESVRKYEVTGETPELTRNRLMHSFGNLTLITGTLNSAQRNQVYSKKLDLLREHSVLHLNKYFLRHDDWNETKILERGEELFKIACAIWPHPNTTVGT